MKTVIRKIGRLICTPSYKIYEILEKIFIKAVLEEVAECIATIIALLFFIYFLSRQGLEFSSVIFGGLITVFIKSILDAATIFVVELFDEVNVILFGIGHAVYEDCDKVIKIEEQRKQQALTFKNPKI